METRGCTHSKSPVPFPPSLPTFFKVTNCSMQESDIRRQAALLLSFTEEGESSMQCTNNGLMKNFVLERKNMVRSTKPSVYR